MKKRKVIPLFALSTPFLTYCVGYGSWVIGLKERGEIVSKAPKIPVCYIGDKKYLTIDAALKDACGNGKADTIYVIPGLGKNLSINNSWEIESTDSLLLPYEGENVLNEKGNNGTDFADNNPSKNRKTLVTLGSGQTLTVNGTLSIGGVTGSGSSPMGQASSSYCELDMQQKSSLIVGEKGTLNCYGYIKESANNNESSITIQNGGTLLTPAVFYDHSSASTSYFIKNNGVFPYKQFDVPQIRPTMIFKYGSTLIGKAHLYGTSAGDILTNANLIGKEGSFINMTSEDSKIIWRFSDTNTKTTNSSMSTHSTKVDVYGTQNFGSLAVTISGVSVDSKDYYLPIPYGYSITVKKDANFTLPSTIKGVKFMPGSSLVSEPGSTLNFNSNILFYQGTKANNGIASFSYLTSDPAVFESNGTTYINKGFEGKISSSMSASSNSESKVIFGSDYGLIHDSKEGTESAIYNWGGAFGIIGETSESASASYFQIGNEYSSSIGSGYWKGMTGEVLPSDVDNIDIVVTDSAGNVLTKRPLVSDYETAADYKMSVNYGPILNGPKDIQYVWNIVNDDTNSSPDVTEAYFNLPKNETKHTSEYATDSSTIEVHTLANSTDSTKYFPVSVYLKFKGVDGEEAVFPVKNDKADPKKIYFNAKPKQTESSGGGCLLPTARVLMADGTYKQGGSIKTGDMVISFNHETGKFEPNLVIGNDHSDSGVEMRNIVHLEFSNGNSTDYIYRHAYFDKTLNKYVNLYEDNFDEYIGHEFVCYDNGNVSTTRLVSASIKEMYTALAAPATANHLNLVTDDMLSIEAGLNGLYNIFEYDPGTLAFDKEKMDADIQKYGLLGYEDFEKYFPKEIYDLLPCKYLAVSIGKGLITWDIFEDYYSRWKDLLMGNL